MSLRQRVLPALIVAGLSFAAAGVALAGSHHDGDRAGPMAKLDSDGDGKIQVADVEADAAKRAAEIDTNADGRITAAEVQVHRELQRQLRAEKRLAWLDADKDGSVSTEEYASSQSARLAKLDSDGDGAITREEFRAGRHDRRGGHRGPRGEAPAE